MSSGTRFIALVLLALGTFPCACSGSKAPGGASEGATQVIEDLILTQSASGNLLWKLQAEKAQLLEETDQALLSKPRMEFYKPSEGRVSQVTALTGRIQTRSQDVLLSSSVVVVSMRDKATLRTEVLEYSSSQEKLHTQAAVELTRPGSKVRGKGLLATPDLSEVRIFHQEARTSGGLK